MACKTRFITVRADLARATNLVGNKSVVAAWAINTECDKSQFITTVCGGHEGIILLVRGDDQASTSYEQIHLKCESASIGVIMKYYKLSDKDYHFQDFWEEPMYNGFYAPRRSELYDVAARDAFRAIIPHV